jgi:hypothetical protein
MTAGRAGSELMILAATRDAARLFLELGTVTVVLASVRGPEPASLGRRCVPRRPSPRATWHGRSSAAAVRW